MLSELHIKNFAIIESLDLNLTSGLIIFTGETGAGKSILIDAVETLLGGKADPSLIRTDSKRAYIEGFFKIDPPLYNNIIDTLSGEELIEDQNYLTLSREIRAEGRNIARINGHSVNLNVLKQVGQLLVDIHGQSEHLSLLRSSRHLELLDNYASTHELMEQYQENYRRYQQVARELKQLQIEERESARRTDMFRYQINEIESARLKIGEEEILMSERNRLANAENLASTIQEARIAIEESTPDSNSAIDLLGKVVDALNSLVRLDPSQNSLSEQAQAIFDETVDLSNKLRKYHEAIEYNPKRLDQIESRLSQIQILRKKYADSIEAILDFARDAAQQLERINHASERIVELETEKALLLNQIKENGEALSHQRCQDAEMLSQRVEAELADLNMSKTIFQVSFQRQADPQGLLLDNGKRISFDANGLDHVEFLIAPNPGEGLKPLVKIASGGETSRLMLAMKHVLVTADNIPSLIFDEIDQGIGGRIGNIVGEKLWRLAQQHQVLCVTHLPQIAAFADMHFHVHKEIRDGRTITLVQKLNDEKRITELAQMIGGISEGTLQSSRELIQNVKTIKSRSGSNE
jgi:DNA repair protein RecN (Recombination protein N)